MRLPTAPRRAFLGLLVLGVAMPAAGEPFSYMKKERPNELYCMASVGETCPLDIDAAQALIDDVTRRFSIRRLEKSSDHEPLFYLELYCHRRGDGAVAYAVETGFAEWTGSPERHLMKYAYYPYKSVGVGGARDLRSTVTRRIEDALADYLAANFPPSAALAQ